MVYVSVQWVAGPGAQAEDTASYVITSFSGSQKMRDYVKGVINAHSCDFDYTIHTYDANSNGETTIENSTGVLQKWKNLTLDPSVSRLVQRDLESFFKRKEWFLNNEIPFRRGYLLHGPPGNGKTSAIKTMLSSLGMNAYKIRLFSNHVTDSTLEKMFRDAQQSGPNMVILEDLDRVFPKTGERKSPIGMHTLLNCLDGMESQEGVITIATANEPTALDRAILKRPGRFDRVVLFNNPNHALRLSFFLNKASYLQPKELEAAVDATEGFSFAQLQETYVMAGQYAYERGSEMIISEDLHVCAAELRGATNSVDTRAEKVGYLK
jgi:ATP-dependent 26S proteasome regulatory subunit